MDLCMGAKNKRQISKFGWRCYCMVSLKNDTFVTDVSPAVSIEKDIRISKESAMKKEKGETRLRYWCQIHSPMPPATQWINLSINLADCPRPSDLQREYQECSKPQDQ